MTLKTQYIKDEHGKNIAVVLTIKEYNRIVEALEDLEDIRLYDEAKKDKDAGILLDEAFKKLDVRRKKA